MRGFHVGACPEAVASDTSEMSKIEVELADTVENFMRCEAVGALEWFKAHAIPEFRFVIPNRPRWRASLLHNSNSVENYLRVIDEEIHA